jgi:hypothetical protein
MWAPTNKLSVLDVFYSLPPTSPYKCSIFSWFLPKKYYYFDRVLYKAGTVFKKHWSYIRGGLTPQEGLICQIIWYYDRSIGLLLRRLNFFDFTIGPPIYGSYGQTDTSQYLTISTICFYTLQKLMNRHCGDVVMDLYYGVVLRTEEREAQNLLLHGRHALSLEKVSSR